MFENSERKTAVRRQRRNFLRAIGGGAALSLPAGVVSATDEEREASGRDASLQDSGAESGVTNTIRDANTPINLSSSAGGWTIRNVGFRNYSSSGQAVIAPAVTDSSQSALIEGCYFGDGGDGPAILVDPSHAGELVIRNCYFEGWGDNAVYGSEPGNPPEHPTPGSGGVVKVENCYAKDNAVSNFRLGTDGSYIKNCVTANGQRGYWGFYGSTRVIDCDIAGGILASDNRWQDPAVIDVENTRFSGGTHLHYSGATIDSTSQGDPRDYYPGVPLSPTDAKNGDMSH